MNLPKRIATDENLHRAAIATIFGELVHLAIDLVLAFFIALGTLPFWGISLGTALAIVFGVFVAHVGIELHDKLDSTHKTLWNYKPEGWEQYAG